MPTDRINRTAFPFLAVGVAAILAACGGGGGDSPTLTLSGVAATGAAFSLQPVKVTCRSGGVAIATTNINGSYSVTLSNGEGPCTVAVGIAPNILYAITPAEGASNTVLVNPISNAIAEAIAKEAGKPIDQLVSPTSSPAPSYIKTVSDKTVTDLNTLLGTNFTVDQFLYDPNFVAARPGTTGSPLDQVLDQIGDCAPGSTTCVDITELEASVSSVVETVDYTEATGATGSSR